ncbi:MAG TPA: efflux RND transporter periplasmic adaptor subunit, partial [Cellvibrionaceae bacterium]|nr:efflux RND transporter periplasmic adaptor subunit [Cellvibrionaceae bacterium]
RLEKILFTEGQWVQKGELLAQLDGRPFAADLAQVEGQAARNRAMLTNAQADLARFTSLGQQTAISAQQIDAQKSLVEQYRGLVQADQGAVEKARLQLEFTQIRAPISGRIGLRRVDPGNNINAQDPEGLALITEVNPIDVVFALPGELAGELAAQLHTAQAQKRRLTVEAWDKANKTRLSLGELLSLDNQIDASTGAIKLKARFSNDAGLLFANQFVNVRVQIQQLKQALVVPTRAILRGSEGPFVYALSHADGVGQPDRAEQGDRSKPGVRSKPGDKTAQASAKPGDSNKPTTSPKQAEAGNQASAPRKEPSSGPIAAVRPVTVGVSQGEYTQISSGLQAGDEVVISGADRLREGIQVRVANSTASGPSGAAITDAQAEVPPKARAF